MSPNLFKDGQIRISSVTVSRFGALESTDVWTVAVAAAASSPCFLEWNNDHTESVAIQIPGAAYLLRCFRDDQNLLCRVFRSTSETITTVAHLYLGKRECAGSKSNSSRWDTNSYPRIQGRPYVALGATRTALTDHHTGLDHEPCIVLLKIRRCQYHPLATTSCPYG